MVYNSQNEIVFMGTTAECRDWVMSQAETVNGRRIFRQWQEDGFFFWDVGTVYHTMFNLFENK